MMLQACFIGLALALIIIVYLLLVNVSLKAFADPAQQRRFITRSAAVLVCWLIYVSAISVTGIFENSSMPPRIPLLLVMPTFLFFTYFFTSKKFKPVIAATPHSWPVYFQSFRVIVELLIYSAFLKGVLPKSATFDGHNFDILIGLTAPLVAYLTFTRGKVSKPLFFLWNVAGLITLAIVVLILMRHAYVVTNDSLSILHKGLGDFPYTYLAGLFMPLAVFMHIFSLVKAGNTPAWQPSRF